MDLIQILIQRNCKKKKKFGTKKSEYFSDIKKLFFNFNDNMVKFF